MSPYAVDARINPVLVVSDILGYVFNWFYNKPIIKKNGVVIIMNPTYEIFHEEYHVAYKMFYDEVLADTTEPFEMQQKFQEKYAKDEYLIDCYRNRFAHHGFQSVHCLVLGDISTETSREGDPRRSEGTESRATARC